jgi:hypothetical protein
MIFLVWLAPDTSLCGAMILMLQSESLCLLIPGTSSPSYTSTCYPGILKGD